MYCIHCGGSNNEQAKFCKKCGLRLLNFSKEKSKGFDKQNKIPKSEEQTKFTVAERRNFKFDHSIINKEKFQSRFVEIRNIISVQLAKLKFNLKMASFLVILVIIVITPFASAYVKYSQIISKAEKIFVAGEYDDALEQLKTINPKRLLPSIKSSLEDRIILYSNVKENNATFELAKTEEENGNLEKAKELLTSISDKTEYPRIQEVIKELSKVGDVITAKIKTDADAKVAEAQRKSNEQAARAKADAVKAAANAAANQAAAEAARQQAQQQAEAAQAGAAQAAAAAREAQANAARIAEEANAAQDTAYINSFSNATKILLRCKDEIIEGAGAYVGGNTQTALNYLLLAVSDCGNVQSTLLDPYPVKFQGLNSAIIDAASAYKNVLIYTTRLYYMLM